MYYEHSILALGTANSRPGQLNMLESGGLVMNRCPPTHLLLEPLIKMKVSKQLIGISPFCTA